MDASLSDQSEDAYEKASSTDCQSVPTMEKKWPCIWMDNRKVCRYSWLYRRSIRGRLHPTGDWVIPSIQSKASIWTSVSGISWLEISSYPTRTVDCTAFKRITSAKIWKAGIVEEEFRVEYVVDRTSTWVQAFYWALTLGCAHAMIIKFDPIFPEDFFRNWAVFSISWMKPAEFLDDAMPGSNVLLTIKKTIKKY